MFWKFKKILKFQYWMNLFCAKKQKVLNFVLTLDDGNWRVKDVPKFFSKYLMHRKCKIKRYLSFISWWYKSKYSCSPKDILKSDKKKEKKEKEKKKNSAPRRQLSKLQLQNFLAKFLTETKYLMKTLTFARRKHKHL